MKGNSMTMQPKENRMKLSLEYFRIEIGIAFVAFVLMLFVASFSSCGDDITKTISSCPEGYETKPEGCVKIIDGELVCSAVRTFQINYLDAETKQPITLPIISTMQHRVTLDDSNGRHRLNDPDGVYLYNSIILCDEYQLSASAVCYESVDRVDFQIPLATIYMIELQPKLHCNNNELDEAFALCLVEAMDNDIGNGLVICCRAFVQDQFDLQCGRL